MDKKSQYEYLLRLLRWEHRQGDILDELTPDDWEGVAEQSFRHGVGTLLLQRLEQDSAPTNFPPEVLEKLKTTRLHIGMKNTKLYHELAGVLNSFHQESISVIVLKGAHLAELVYRNISLRPMDDIDLLVKKLDLQRTEEKLFALGYNHLAADAERMKSTTPHHLTAFRKKGQRPIEVHWTLPSMGSLATDVDNIWARTQNATIAGGPTLVLSCEDLLLHVIIHASLHHRFGLGLRPLCDIAAIVDRYAGVLDWDKVRAYAQEWGLSNGVHLTLSLAKELVGANIPEPVLQAMKPEDFDITLSEWAKEQIFTRNTELGDSSAMSPRLAQFLGSGSFSSKIQQLFRLAFPSREDMAREFGISSYTHRLFLSYPLHWKDVLLLRGGVVWRLFRRDKATVAKTEIYQKLMDKPKNS